MNTIRTRAFTAPSRALTATNRQKSAGARRMHALDSNRKNRATQGRIEAVGEAQTFSDQFADENAEVELQPRRKHKTVALKTVTETYGAVRAFPQAAFAAQALGQRTATRTAVNPSQARASYRASQARTIGLDPGASGVAFKQSA